MVGRLWCLGRYGTELGDIAHTFHLPPVVLDGKSTRTAWFDDLDEALLDGIL